MNITGWTIDRKQNGAFELSRGGRTMARLVLGESLCLRPEGPPGEAAAVVSIDANGQPSLHIRGAEGPRTEMHFLPRPTIELFAADGRRAAVFSINDTGCPTIAMFDDKEDLAAVVTLNAAGSAVMALTDNAGRSHAMTEMKDGHAVMVSEVGNIVINPPPSRN